jgi:hypothetical protein
MPTLVGDSLTETEFHSMKQAGSKIRFLGHTDSTPEEFFAQLFLARKGLGSERERTERILLIASTTVFCHISSLRSLRFAPPHAPLIPHTQTDKKVLPLGRDLGAARDAFNKGDINAMIAAHDGITGAEEIHAGVRGICIVFFGERSLIRRRNQRMLGILSSPLCSAVLMASSPRLPLYLPRLELPFRAKR